MTSLLFAGALLALAGCSGEPEPLAVEGSSKAAKLTQCVEPTDFMRRNHMELIKHQRDETVHKGIRETNYSLAGCVDCHVQYDASHQPVPVTAEGQFCDGCHDYTGVHLDCFQCHATVPTSPGSSDLALHDPLASGAGSRIALRDGAGDDLQAVAQEKGD